MKIFLITSALVLASATALSGTGGTTRYWDCSVPSCSSQKDVGRLHPVDSCAADGVTKLSPSDTRAAYVCNNLQPWAVNNSLAYGFVTASFTSGVDNSKCCICLKLTFLNALKGKTFIVQNVNTDSPRSVNSFNILIPGGGSLRGLGVCDAQWQAPPQGWGDQYGGVASDADCNQLPRQLQAGCHFRFSWFQNANNPQVRFEQIQCPKELTQQTNCVSNNLF